MQQQRIVHKKLNQQNIYEEKVSVPTLPEDQ